MASKTVRKLKLKWENRFSRETGFVKAIRESRGHFENGSVDEARVFRSNAECQKAISILKQIGEAENNDFYITSEDGTCVEAEA